MVKLAKDEDAGCTFNFLFRGSDGNRYIGTAGHCILDKGERSWPIGEGPQAFDADGNQIGRFAYAVLKNPRDFALIRLDESVAASGQMCHWGGPNSLYTEKSPDPVELKHFGNGLVLGYEPTTGSSGVMPARTALAMNTQDPDEVVALGVAAFGDSGSGVMTAEGGAVGVLVAGGFGIQNSNAAGDVFITRLPPQLRQAEDALRVHLRLMKAPLQQTVEQARRFRPPTPLLGP
ncbi:MAG: trypsin-like serine protease [Actinomycetota bacterium]